MIDNKNIEKINRMLQKQIVQRFSVLAVAALVIGSVAYFGINRNQFSSAASVGILSMTTSAGSSAVTVGSNVTVTIKEDSGTDNVNSVQASISYDSTKLQYLSMAEGTAFTTIAANSTSTPGLIRVARGTPQAGITGANDVVTLTFKVLGNSGTTALAYDPAFSYIVRSSDAVNILTSNTGASVAMKLPAPTVSTVTPTSGLTTGGTVVTIAGTNFVTGATVTVGGVAATSVGVSANQITATVPANTAGAKSIVVTNPDGQTGTLANAFTYTLPAPTISTVVPTSGLITGGTSITVTGTNFVSGATVTVGGTSATSVVVASSTSITATIPAHAAGIVDVVVKNPDNQQATKTGAFTYNNLAPTIGVINPSSGPSAGGTTILINGANFLAGATVKIGTVTLTSGNVTVQSPNVIAAITPAQASGVYTVTVTNPDTQNYTKANAFTYINPAPTLASISPTTGVIGGGTAITITGANFLSGATVTIGGIQASSVTFVSPTQISAITPVGTPGPKAVVVTNSDGQVTTASVSFNYLSNPGDANNDGRVNAIDLSILISHDAQNYAPADFNGDGQVGSADLAVLIGHWTW